MGAHLLRGRCRARRVRAVAEDDVVTGLREPGADRRPDPAPAAGDDGQGHSTLRTVAGARPVRRSTTSVVTSSTPLAGRRAERGVDLGHVLRHARVLDEARGVGGVVDVHDLDRLAAELAVELREVGGVERLRPRDVVGLVLMAVGAQDRGGDGRAVLARDVGRAAAAGVGHQPAARDRRLRAGRLQVGVEVVAQERVREAGGEDRLLGLAVLRGDGGRVLGTGVDDARVGDVPRAGPLGGLDRRLVLRHARADRRQAHEQHLGGAGERGLQRGRVVEVAVADLGPQLPDGVRRAGDEDDVRGLRVEEELRDAPAELA